METYAGPQASYKPKPLNSQPQFNAAGDVSGQRNGMTYMSEQGGGQPAMPKPPGGPGVNVTTGVQAGPIYNPQQHQAAVQGIGQFAANNRANQTSQPGPAGAALTDNYDQNSRFNASRSMNSADRAMTQTNANEYNRSQQAQARAGGAWAQTGMQGYAQDLAQQAQRRNMLMSLLGNFMQG